MVLSQRHVLSGTRRVFPENNADLGAGFGVVDYSPNEIWVITSEAPTKGSRDYKHVLMAKLLCRRPTSS